MPSQVFGRRLNWCLPVRHFGFAYVASLQLRSLAVHAECKRMLVGRWFIGLE